MKTSRLRRPLWVALVAAASAACAHDPPPLGSTRLVVETTRTGGVRPFVRATVAGKPLPLLLDTGAGRSMLPAGFARANAIRKGRAATDAHVVDANGRLAVLRSLPDVPVHIEGEAAGGTIDFFMTPSAGTDEGIVAPRDLLRRGWALVIDLGRETLTHEPEQAALARARADGAALRELDWDGCRDEDMFEKSHRVVRATVNGVDAKMLIDTGAETSVLARNHPALRFLIERTGERGATQGVVSVGAGLLVEDVPIVFADTPFVLPTIVLPASSGCGHGVLGADLLRHCTIVWGWTRVWVACRTPDALAP